MGRAKALLPVGSETFLTRIVRTLVEADVEDVVVPAGKFRIYLGSVAGVGKTCAMLDEGWRRSQRGADAILVGDVKKIAVTLTIDREGNVSDLQLSDHAADTLGKCLTGAIRTWKFRPSAGGTFKFSMNFVDG